MVTRQIRIQGTGAHTNVHTHLTHFGAHTHYTPGTHTPIIAKGTETPTCSEVGTHTYAGAVPWGGGERWRVPARTPCYSSRVMRS